MSQEETDQVQGLVVLRLAKASFCFGIYGPPQDSPSDPASGCILVGIPVECVELIILLHTVIQEVPLFFPLHKQHILGSCAAPSRNCGHYSFSREFLERKCQVIEDSINSNLAPADDEYIPPQEWACRGVFAGELRHLPLRQCLLQ